MNAVSLDQPDGGSDQSCLVCSAVAGRWYDEFSVTTELTKPPVVCRISWCVGFRGKDVCVRPISGG